MSSSSNNNDRSYLLQWDVSLSQFHVDQSLYNPKPALSSPIVTTPTDHLLLDWQLSLEQGQTDAAVFLHHRTKNLPNQGVRYTVFAVRQDGSSVRLTDPVRKALNTLSAYRLQLPSQAANQTDPDRSDESKQKFFCLPGGGKKSSSVGTAERLVWPGNQVKIRVIIELNDDLWSPHRMLNERVQAWKRANPKLKPGMLGEHLWQQVALLKPDESVPYTTDLVLVCMKGERIVAHKSVVAGFSHLILDEAQHGPRGQLIMLVSGVGPAALWEALHYIYRQHLSPKFHRAPLNELLEADHMFGLPDIVKLEVEKIFAQILDSKNRVEMSELADKYELEILQNMIKKLEQDASDANESELKQSEILTDEEKAAVFAQE